MKWPHTILVAVLLLTVVVVTPIAIFYAVGPGAMSDILLGLIALLDRSVTDAGSNWPTQ